ncbi:DUF3592 domain-containing protein [Neoroseomonas oryzicola]|uniref:DUF3592 domain-containing protein n=1 Tax=Neoroseomonas oryzicola TaxID=535904 RepID=A0A9X9WG09_9PROT|nr:DUF3592 domain-containing protein [Neoroseomonas oryzicola]MBR0659269.1 DUF3592 domain-containing protein [Neoroseomonas oryzicola]NKE15597.1 DUF3592 domain-containing protein [Neoroseomonas oryzicola]
MQITTTTTTTRTLRPGSKVPKIIGSLLLLVGIGLLVGSGFAIWTEVKFRRIAVETDGRVVEMLRSSSRDRDGRSSVTYKPVFVFRLPEGKEIRVEGGVSSNPPCCRVGDVVRVRYDPAHPDHAQMTGFMESWFVATLLGGMGLVFALIASVALRISGKAGAVALPGTVPAAGGNMMTFAVPLVGLRREGAGHATQWILQARWQDPRSGVPRLFESPPLPFDPVPQMRQMTTVNIQFDPGDPNSPYAMDLSFLQAPGDDPDATIAVGPVRRG